MFQKTPALAGILLTGLALWAACTKSTPFGADLLEDQQADYAYTDTVSLRCTVVREDSISTSDRSSATTNFLCGELNDPVFGKTRSELYTLCRLSTIGLNFSEAAIDSVVMYLRYNTAGVYGDTIHPQTLQVFRLSEQLEWDKNYFANESLAAGAEVGRLDGFMPRPNKKDSLPFAATDVAFLRIPLDKTFGEDLFNLDSVSLATDTAFWKALKGLKIVTSAGNPAGSPGAMLGFNLNDRTYSLIRVYYKNNDTIPRRFDFEFAGGNKFTHFTHEYAGTQAGQQIDQTGGDLLYVQGMQGLQVRIDLPYASDLDDIVINKAELEFTVASVPGDFAQLKPASQLILTEPRGDTVQVSIDDVLYSLNTNSQDFSLFGGQPKRITVGSTSLERYHLNLSSHFQKVIADAERKTLFLSVFPQNGTAMRSVLYGPGHPDYPARLILKYTRLK